MWGKVWLPCASDFAHILVGMLHQGWMVQKCRSLVHCPNVVCLRGQVSVAPIGMVLEAFQASFSMHCVFRRLVISFLSLPSGNTGLPFHLCIGELEQ